MNGVQASPPDTVRDCGSVQPDGGQLRRCHDSMLLGCQRRDCKVAAPKVMRIAAHPLIRRRVISVMHCLSCRTLHTDTRRRRCVAFWERL